MTNIFIANLDWEITSEDLKVTFSAFGSVHLAHVVFDAKTKKSKGFGYVEMESAEEAIAAIQALNGFEVNDRKLDVKIASPKSNRPKPEDKPKKPFQKKPFQGGGGQRNFNGPRQGGGGGGYRSNNQSGERKPWNSEGQGERKPYNSGGQGGERKPWNSEGQGERKPWNSDRSSAERKPWNSEGQGERKSWNSEGQSGESKPSASEGSSDSGERKLRPRRTKE